MIPDINCHNRVRFIHVKYYIKSIGKLILLVIYRNFAALGQQACVKKHQKQAGNESCRK
jgi:hypothetical protein